MKIKLVNPSEIYNDPLRLLIITIFSIFFAETIVMLFLFFIPAIPLLVEALLDAVIVSILVFPIFYLLSYKPLMLHIAKRKQIESVLNKIQDELEIKVKVRTSELSAANNKLKVEIAERVQAETALKVREKDLEDKTKSLEELNSTLKVLLKKRDEDKEDIEEKILINIKQLLLPYLEKLEQTQLQQDQFRYIEILKSNLDGIVSPFLQNLSSSFINLTPMEIKVANLIKDGKTTKEIAEFLGVSIRTVDGYRSNLREKMKIKNKKTNLSTYLLKLKK